MICYPDTTDWSCYGDETAVAALDAANKARAEAMAWMTLAALTAYRINTCPTVVRPCAQRFFAKTYYVAPVGDDGAPFRPYISGGVWRNGCGCSSAGACACTSGPTIPLGGEVGEITKITIDGVTLTDTAYRVENGNLLVRTDGAAWPLEDNTLEITYWQGVAPNDVTNFAAGVLAAEFYKACVGDKKCRLPSTVRSITRQGVTMEIDAGLFENGYTGLREVDALIRIYNPHNLKAQARVLVPGGSGRPRTTTWRR